MMMVGGEEKFVPMGLDTGSGSVAMAVAGGGTVVAQIMTPDGLVAMPGAEGQLMARQGMNVALGATGFQPGSTVRVAMTESKPLLRQRSLPAGIKVATQKSMGELQVDETGSVALDMALDSSTKPGSYVLVMDGVSTEGETWAFSLAMDVVSEDEFVDVMRPASQLDASNVRPAGVALVLFLLFAVSILIANRRDARGGQKTTQAEKGFTWETSTQGVGFDDQGPLRSDIGGTR
jgi:hypothetical protein